MADKLVSALTDIDALADADSFPVLDASATSELKEVTASQIATYMASELAGTFEASGGLSAHLADTVDAHDASAISFTPAGTIAGTDVQTAVAEVATDAASALSTHSSDTTSVHGIADTSALLDSGDIGTTVQAYSAVLAATTASFTTADETKLDGIEVAADVTDATNVAAAGAAMLTDSPSELVPDPPEVVSGATDTLAAADHGHLNRYTNGSLVTVTLPTDASADLVDGFWCALYAEGAGGLTLSTTGITLTGVSPNTTIAQNEVMIVMKTATANTWLALGATSA